MLIEHMIEDKFMNQFYCRTCAQKHNMGNPVNELHITGTRYQLEKYDKHTEIQPSGILNSVFDDSTPAHISGLMASGLNLGWYAKDTRNRQSLVWVAGKQIGTTYSDSGKQEDGSLRVVLYKNQHTIHAYPTASKEILNAQCSTCGKSYSAGEI